MMELNAIQLYLIGIVTGLLICLLGWFVLWDFHFRRQNLEKQNI